MKKLKIALVHDYLKEYGGAERVLEALHELYPDAPVYTSVYLPQYLGPHKERFRDWKIHTSWAQYLPFKAKLISPLRVISPLLFKQFDFSDYDVVIVSATGAYFPNTIRTKKEIHHKPVHLCYCHTPPRYLYGYATARNWRGNMVTRAMGAVMGHILRIVDFKASQHVDQYISNSQEVAARIRKFYRKEAVVINPPVEVADSVWHIGGGKQHKKQGDYELRATTYYLTGGRLARAKHIDLAVSICSQLGLPLKVFGKAFAGYGDELKSLAGNTVEFLGEVSDDEKWQLLSGAKAFLFTAEDEDFGILPVEAMAAGTPVIAYRSGGVQETVVEGKTGLFFDELTEDSLQTAIEQLGKTKISPEACKKHAERFSKERFWKEIQRVVEKTVDG